MERIIDYLFLALQYSMVEKSHKSHHCGKNEIKIMTISAPKALK